MCIIFNLLKSSGLCTYRKGLKIEVLNFTSHIACMFLITHKIIFTSLHSIQKISNISSLVKQLNFHIKCTSNFFKNLICSFSTTHRFDLHLSLPSGKAQNVSE